MKDKPQKANLASQHLLVTEVLLLLFAFAELDAEILVEPTVPSGIGERHGKSGISRRDLDLAVEMLVAVFTTEDPACGEEGAVHAEPERAYKRAIVRGINYIARVAAPWD